MSVHAQPEAPPMLVAADDIDPTFVPRPHDDVIEVEVGEDMVIVRTQPFILNRTAALVWRCLDGESSLEELVADLVAVTGVDEEVIRHDVVELVRALTVNGLLAGIAPPPVPDEYRSWTPPTELAVGVPFEEFTLPDLDDELVRLADLRDGRLLLVNWSPGCGFCLKIGTELGKLQEPLRERGVSIAFVSSGPSETNRRVMDEAGISAPVVLKTADVDPFVGFGTPAAYLLDAEGRVAAPMAYGADRVPLLARELAGIEEPAPVAGARYLPAPAAVCGSGGGAAPSGTTWLGTRAYRFGEFHVGVRYNTDAAADVLDRLFPGLRMDDPRVPDNFSLALSSGDGRSRDLNLLVRGATQLARSRSTARVLNALLGYLSAELVGRDPALLYLGVTGAVKDGTQGLLLPPGLVNWVKQLQPRLSRRGIQLVDLPWAAIDPTTHALVVPPAAIEHDPRVLEAFGEERLGSELPYVRAGRYPIRGWFISAAGDGAELDLLAPPTVVAASTGLVLTDRDCAPDALAKLAAVALTVPTRTISASTPESFVRELEQALV